MRKSILAQKVQQLKLWKRREKQSSSEVAMDKIMEARLVKLSQLINNALMENKELGDYVTILQEENVKYRVEIQAAVYIENAKSPTQEEVSEQDKNFLTAMRISTD